MTAPHETLYLGDLGSSFQNGVQFDLRVKLAVEFLKAPGLTLGADAAGAARFALSLADQLMSQADERGWLKPLPDDDSLNRQTRQHIKRSVRAQVYQQNVAQTIAAEEAPVLNPNGGGRLVAG